MAHQHVRLMAYRPLRREKILHNGVITGLSSVVCRLGLLRWLSPTLDVAEGLVVTMPGAFLRDRLPRLHQPEEYKCQTLAP